ncbi:MAG: hypothetical protein ACR2P8_11370, partial [Myxococcota bacterium]
AQSWASAVSEGDGHPVRVGAPPSEAEPGRIQVLTGAAVGGSGGSFQPVTQGTLGSPRRLVTAPESLNRPGGDGGDASSFSLGIARGRSPVEVYDGAIGGSAGLPLASFTPVAGQPGLETYEEVGAGVGGEARSVAVGLGSAEPIQVRASAIGGPAGNLTEVVPEGAEPFDPDNDIFVGGAVIEIVDPTDDGSGLSNQFVPFDDGSGPSNTFVPGGDGPGPWIPFVPIAIDDVQFFGVVTTPFVPIAIDHVEFFGVQRVRVLGEFGERGGPAHAKAQAVGSGPIEADAEATGGAGSLWSTSYAHLRHEGGPARAEASGTGSEGRVRALAGSNAPTLSLKVGAASTLLETARAEARIAPDALDPPKLGRRRLRRLFSLPDATAHAVISPPRALTDAPVAHDSAALAALDDRLGSARPAAGRWAARQRQRSWGSPVETTWTLELRTERNLFDDPLEQYRVALLDPEISGWGFRSLRVTLEKEGEVRVDETFSDAEAARAYLDGRILEVGTLAGIALPFPTLTPTADGSTSSGLGTEIGDSILDPRRSEVAVLTFELVTDRTGATASLDFVVARLPIDAEP